MEKVKFVVEKETKNTIRFTEQVEGLDSPAIGILYVQKHALKEIGYTEGAGLVVTLEVAK